LLFNSDEWRIPTFLELENLNVNGNWQSYFDAFQSELKMHAAGYLYYTNGNLGLRGGYGRYWSLTQFDDYNGLGLVFDQTSSFVSEDYYKSSGFSIRCIKD